MPRHPIPVEFLNLLKELLATSTDAQFAKRIGKQTPNVSSYLRGRRTPGKKTLLSSARHAFEWEVTPLYEVEPIKKEADLPETPGVYALYDSAGTVLYLGQASNLKREVYQTLNRPVNESIRRGPNLSKRAKPRYGEIAHFLSVYIVPSSRMRHNVEALLLRVFPNQTHNNKMGEFK